MKVTITIEDKPGEDDATLTCEFDPVLTPETGHSPASLIARDMLRVLSVTEVVEIDSGLEEPAK